MESNGDGTSIPPPSMVEYYGNNGQRIESTAAYTYPVVIGSRFQTTSNVVPKLFVIKVHYKKNHIAQCDAKLIRFDERKIKRTPVKRFSYFVGEILKKDRKITKEGYSSLPPNIVRKFEQLRTAYSRGVICVHIDGACFVGSSLIYAPIYLDLMQRRGYCIVYLTARGCCEAGFTRDWLLANYFPAGPVFFSHRNAGYTMHHHQERYKALMLIIIQTLGMIRECYGNKKDRKTFEQVIERDQIFNIVDGESWKDRILALDKQREIEPHIRELAKLKRDSSRYTQLLENLEDVLLMPFEGIDAVV